MLIVLKLLVDIQRWYFRYFLGFVGVLTHKLNKGHIFLVMFTHLLSCLKEKDA